MTNQYDLSIDIYSYGVTFVEIWTGKKPYSDKNYKYHGKKQTHKHHYFAHTNYLCIYCLFGIEFIQGVTEGTIVK